MRSLILFFALFTVVLFSCKSRKPEVTQDAIEVEAACDASITYTSSVKAIFDANCVKCHSGERPKAGVKLTDYENASKVVDHRLNCVVTWSENCNKMPPFGGQLSGDDIQKITCWIKNGKPN